MSSADPPMAPALLLRHALRAMGRGELLEVRAAISDALALLEAGEHTPVNPCPRCGASATYLAGDGFMCTVCAHVWNPFTQAVDKGLRDNDARPGGITPDQRRSIDAAFTMLAVGGRPEQLIYASAAANRVITDLAELSYDEAGHLAEVLILRKVRPQLAGAETEQETGP